CVECTCVLLRDYNTHRHTGIKVFRHRARFPACGLWLRKKILKIKKKKKKTRLDIITITFEFMSLSANEMKGAQLSRSQNNIISQSEVDWGGSWGNVLQTPTFLYRSA